jgi:Asp/Glu/Hydantoin racemase
MAIHFNALQQPNAGGTGFLGIIMLDTQFPRPLGDVGHPDTFGLSVHFETIKGVWPDKVVQSAASLRQARIVPGLQNIVRLLDRKGAWAITTSCGFLVLLQKELQAVTRVPVISSSLMQLPALLKTHAQVGVLTISAGKLGAEHLRAAGVPKERLKDVLVQGVNPSGEFATQILTNQATMDLDKASADVVAAAAALRQRSPALQVVVLECTNMPPYRAAITAATGLQTFCLTDDQRLLKPFSTKPTVPNTPAAHTNTVTVSVAPSPAQPAD